jgi:hypothetical protein
MSEEGLTEIRKIVDKYNSHETCSVRLDTSCQDATNRYEIFRSDGNVYDSWEAMAPKGVNKATVKLDPLENIVPNCEESPMHATLSNSEYNQQLNNLKEEWMQKFVYKKDIAPVIIKRAEESDYE